VTDATNRCGHWVCILDPRLRADPAGLEPAGLIETHYTLTPSFGMAVGYQPKMSLRKRTKSSKENLLGEDIAKLGLGINSMDRDDFIHHVGAEMMPRGINVTRAIAGD
jgi:hypothetical protein